MGAKHSKSRWSHFRCTPEVEEVMQAIARHTAELLGTEAAHGAVNTIRFGVNFIIGTEHLLLLIGNALNHRSHDAWLSAFVGVNDFINAKPNGDLKRALLLSFFDPLYRRLGLKIGSILNDEASGRYTEALKLHALRPEREGWKGKDSFPQKVMVTGASHSGTTLVSALIRASGQFDFYFGTEDRDYFSRRIPPRHGAKFSTDLITWEEIQPFLEKHKDLYIVFSIRNPVDIALSHLVRARPQEEGGDSWDGETDEFANVDGACYRIEHMFGLYTKLKEFYPHRVLFLKLDDVIQDLNSTIDNVCTFLALDRKPSMEKPWEYVVHKFMHKRYNKIDPSQIDVYKRWETAYDGFYADKKEDVVELCNKLRHIAEGLGYELEDINDDPEDSV